MNITRMADMVHEAVPGCRLYIQERAAGRITRRLAYPGLKRHNPQVRDAQCAVKVVVRRQAVVYVRRFVAAFRCRRRTAHRPDEGRNPPPPRGVCDLDRLPQEQKYSK